MTRPIVISHEEDADGFTAAVLLKRQFPNAKVLLTDYPGIIDTLKKVTEKMTEGRESRVFITDLGINDSTYDQFYMELTRIRQFAYIIYIDHHAATVTQRLQLSKIVNHVWDNAQCASILTYSFIAANFHFYPTFFEEIMTGAAAFADYLDNEPTANAIIKSFDRGFTVLQACYLSSLIDGCENNVERMGLFNQLASGKFPHQIKGATEAAHDFAKEQVKLVADLVKDGKVKGKFAYYQAEKFSCATAANFIRGVKNVDVGVAFKEDKDTTIKMSLRATDRSTYNLSEIMKKLSIELGFSGGGHPKAAGAGMTREQLPKFLDRLEEELQ